MAPDLDIDDSDLPEFRNFYEFCYHPDGIATYPFNRQLALAIELLGEWCPRCSGRKLYNIHKVPVGYKAKNFPDHIQLLEHGVCPSCNVTRPELFKTGELNPYVELDAVIGQRAGKALALDTPIPTADGWKFMRDIQVGDKVFGYSGKQVEVQAVTKVMRNRECAKLTFDNGDTIVCDMDHQWKVETRTRGKGKDQDKALYPVSIKTTKELMETQSFNAGNNYHCARHKIHIPKPIQYDEKDLPIPPYTLGAWLGDGSQSRPVITNHPKDIEIVNRIKQEEGEWEVGNSYGKTGTDALNYYIRKPFEYLLAENNLTNNKHIPEIYLQGSVHQRQELLRGIMDTDGYMTNRGRCEIQLCNEDLIHGVNELLSSLGIKVNAHLKAYDAKIYGRKVNSKWRILFTPPEFPIFHLKRKLDLQMKAVEKRNSGSHKKHSYYKRIVNIEKVPSVPVKCIQVKGGMFLCGDTMIPTHNSSLISIIIPYLIHKWLKIPNPTKMLGLMPSSILVGTFVGLTFQKAVELLWQPMTNSMLQCPWFQKLHELLDYYQNKDGRELYSVKHNFIQYNYRSIFLSPSGPNKRTLRGATRILSALDELGWFPHGEDNEYMERASANEVYVALDRSLKTVRTKVNNLIKRKGMANIPMAYSLNISSPSSYWDKIMTLLRTHAGSRDVYTCQLATWEFNPEYTKEDFEKDYRDDPVKAERDFGANPPMAANPWMGNPEAVLNNIGKRHNAIDYRYMGSTSRSGQRQRYAKLTGARHDGSPTVIAIDAGYSQNSFAVAVIGACEPPQRAKIHALAEVAPKQGESVINYSKMTSQFLVPLVEEFNAKIFIADRWQSVKILSDIEEECLINSFQHTLVSEECDLIRDYLCDETEMKYITLPKPEVSMDDIMDGAIDLNNYPECFRNKPVSHFLYQLQTCTVDQKGVVQKGDHASDDIVRAVCCGLQVVLDDEVVEEFGLLRSGGKPGKFFLGVRPSENVHSSKFGVVGKSSGSSVKVGGSKKSQGNSNSFGAVGNLSYSGGTSLGGRP